MQRVNRLILAALLSLLFLVILIPQGSPVRAADNTIEDFEYDSVWWEDWTKTTTSVAPSSTWNANNHTMLLSVTIPGDSAGATCISRPLVPKAEKLDVSWYARHNLPTNDTYPAWWNSSWTYRQPVPIIGSTSGAVTNYQLYFFLTTGSGVAALNTIHLNNHAQADFDDVRFIQDSTVCDLWYERVTATAAIVWVEVPTIAAGPTVTKFYCYYGNPTAPSIASGPSTFLGYSTWDTGTPTSVGEGTFAVNAPSWLDWAGLGTGTTWHGARTANVSLSESQPLGLRVRTWWDFSSSAAANRMGRLWLKGTTNAYAGQFMFMMYDGNGVGIENVVAYYDYGTSTYNWASNVGPQNSTWELRLWENAGNDYWIFSNFTQQTAGDRDFAYTIDRWSIGIEGYGVLATYPMSERTHDDWFFFSKFISPEPLATAGMEQYVSDPTPDQLFRVSFPYAVTTGWHFVNVTYSATNVSLSYYDGMGNPQSTSTALSAANAHAYLISALSFTQPVGPKVLSVTVKTALSVTLATFSVTDPEAFPTGLTKLSVEERAVNAKYSFYYTSVEVVVVKAPFPPVSGLRSWRTTNLESTDSPYYLYKSEQTDENCSILIMPFQGIKWLWNLTYYSSPNTAQGIVEIWWYSMAGARVGGVRFYALASSTMTTLSVYSLSATGTATSLGAKNLEANSIMSIAVWTEKSGKTFAYVQYTSHSSEFQDYMIFDITAFTDMMSWGVLLIHSAKDDITLTEVTLSCLSEVEIFYGMREGISQPRFGGMWWESNPILVAFFWIGVWFSSIFYAVGSWIWGLIGPAVLAFQNAVGGWFTGLQAAIGGWFASVSADVGAWFVGNFLPAAGAFIEAFIAVFIMVILTPVTGILALISIFLTGNPYLLPVAILNFLVLLVNIFNWIGTAFAGIVTFFGMMAAVASGQPIGIADTGLALTIVDLINRVLFYIVTYGPWCIMLHVAFSVLACLPHGTGGFFTVDPLVNCFLFYWHIVEAVGTFFFRVFSFLANIIISIMELIPF